MKLYPVIMCGGAGSRLWPRSRAATPKQFLNLVESRSLLAATAVRLSAAKLDVEMTAPVIICGNGQESDAIEQTTQTGLPPLKAIIEPFGKNTAAVAAVATLEALNADPDALVLLLPADHHVADFSGFWDGVSSGIAAALDDYIVTLGIEPTGPETGYGYIQQGEPITDNVYAVERFKEKPDAETAEEYLATGNFSWNAGIFLFRAKTMKAAFDKYAPEVWAACAHAFEAGSQQDNCLHLDPDAFATCPSEPVDIAIMEKADRIAVVAPVRAGWNDVGSWDAIAELKTQLGTNTPDETHVFALDCEDCLIETDGPFVGAVGLEGLVIVATEDAVLVIDRKRSQDVKKIVTELKRRDRKDLL